MPVLTRRFVRFERTENSIIGKGPGNQNDLFTRDFLKIEFHFQARHVKI